MNAIQSLLTEHIDIWTTADIGPKSGRGRSSANAASVYGIRKLRELILELAVCGKLVPQDAKDEPACELLKRIHAEKAKLIAEGKIKKDKPLAAISGNEKPFELPQGWEWATLASISLVNPRNSAEDNSHASFVPMTMIGTRFNSLHDQEARLWREIKQGFTHFAEGDIGIAKITPCFENSKACVFSGLQNGIGAGTTELHIVRPINATLSPRYVLTYLKSPQFLLVGETKMTGTAGQKRLPKEFVESNPFPLPPLAEQHRIVAKVDELMALCDQLETRHNNAAEAHEKLVSHLLGTLTQSQNAADFSANWQRIFAHFDTLFTTEASIDALKQNLLQLAVMGKLVPQDPNDELASELLKRIQAEKAKLIAEGKIKKDKPLPQITDEEKPFALPLGWEWVRFSDYATDIATGPFGTMIHQSDYVEGGVPLINPSHMIDDKIVADIAVSVSLGMAKTLDSYVINEGDIVMARRGEVGRIALVTKDENGWLCGTGSFVLRFFKEICRDYLRIVFRCEYARVYLAGEAVGTTMVNLNHGILKKMPMGLPPIAEQNRIVAKVDELMALCDQLKSRITSVNQLQQKLADVLVEQAVA